MTLEEALYAYLSSHAGLSALVGSRIYPATMPQNVTLPAVTYFRVAGGVERTSGPTVAYRDGRFQVSAWAELYATAKAVATQIRDALQNYQGTMGGAEGVRVLDANVVSETDIYEPETGTYQVAVDVVFLYE